MKAATKQCLALFAVAASWLVASRLLARYAFLAMPLSLTRWLKLQGYLSLTMVVSTAFGLGLAVVLLDEPRRVLAVDGLRKLSLRGLALVGLISPIVFVAIAYAAIGLAWSTLVAEYLAGGKQAVAANQSEVDRSLAQAHVAVVILWATVLTPIAEELIFRGALWTWIRRLTRAALKTGPASLPAELIRESWIAAALRALWRWLLNGGIATVVTTVVFAWLHADASGAAGIIRVSSVAGLALTCGVLRHAMGSLVPPILFHGLFNLMSLATARRWVITDTFGKYYMVPTLLSVVAAVCAVVLIGWGATAAFKRWRYVRVPTPSDSGR